MEIKCKPNEDYVPPIGRIKCDHCGKFIAHKDVCMALDHIEQETGWHIFFTLCKKCNQLNDSGGN